MKVVGLIQARMGSVRLPGKVMRPLAGKPLIWHILDRLRRVDGVSAVVLATTVAPENEPLVAWAKGEGLSIVRHPDEDDIAGRLAMAVDATGADLVVKANADCPLMDPAVAAAALELFMRDRTADGVTNKLRPTFPLGLSIEVLTQRVITWCHDNLTSAADRELMVKWIFEHPKQFRVLSLESPLDDSCFNLAVDTLADYALVSEIFNVLYVEGQCFGWPAIRDFLLTRKFLPACAYLEPAAAL